MILRKNKMTNGTSALNTNKDQWETPEAMTSNPKTCFFVQDTKPVQGLYL